MDGLTLKLTAGNKKALSLVKTLVTSPTLINTDTAQGAIYALVLDVETNQKSASAEVSESLVIATDTKKYINDNVAPGARSWSLSGYIRGIPRLEPTNYFQPFVQLQTDILWNWFNKGAILMYKDGNAQIYNHVVIKDLQTAQQKDSANATPFSMTLKEINVMKTNVEELLDTSEGTDRLEKSLPTVGGKIGASANLGMTSAEVVESL